MTRDGESDPTVDRATYSRRSLHGQMATRLGHQIAAGELAPGSVLPSETELMARFGVSRPVMREAVLILVAKGMLESRRRVGTHVRPRSEWNLLDPDVLDWVLASASAERVMALFELREVVEPGLARRAAERAPPSSVAAIGAALEQMERTVDCLQAFIDPDLEFHDRIARATGNEFFSALGGLLRDAVLSLMIVTQISEAVRRRRLELHRAVYDAIAAADPDRAELAMHTLLREARSDLVAVLSAKS